METHPSGWATAACIWGVVCVLAYLLKISKQWVSAYRIRRGRKQMNEWLEAVGKGLDTLYVDGTPYSKDAVKKWLAEMSVRYFKSEIQKHQE